MPPRWWEKGAREALATVREEMTAEQIAEAEAMATTWRPRAAAAFERAAGVLGAVMAEGLGRRRVTCDESFWQAQVCVKAGRSFPRFETDWEQLVALEEILELGLEPVSDWVRHGNRFDRLYKCYGRSIRIRFDRSRAIAALLYETPYTLAPQALIFGGSVTPPILISSSKVRPSYPERPRDARIEGNVILEAVIDQRGVVRELSVLRCIPPGLGFEQSAIQAVSQWRYEPATQDGHPVIVYFTVVVDYALQ